MTVMRFEVWWSDTLCKDITTDPEQRVCDVIEQVRRFGGATLPEEDHVGHAIEYALYIEDHGQWVPLQRRRSIARAGIGQKSQIYLADRKAPWWQQERKTGDRNTVPEDRPPPVPPPLKQRICRLQLAVGCIVMVPAKGLPLGREYLLSTLPRTVVFTENVKDGLGLGSRLARVSRHKHCELFWQDEVLMLRANEPTYVGRRLVGHDTVIALTEPTTITLGRDGWPVDVQFDSLAE